MNISKELKVGTLTAVALVLFYFGFNFLKGIDFFSGTNSYYALYENIDGLIESNPVIINGYSVGRVSDIKINQQGDHMIRVQIDIDEEIMLGENTVALLANTDFLGSKAIVLEIEETIVDRLQDGDTLLSDLDRGITDLLKDSAVPVADNLELTIRKINTILENFEGTGDQIKENLRSLENATNTFSRIANENRLSIKNTVDNTATLSEDLKGTVARLNTLLETSNQTAKKINQLEIEQSLVKLDESLTKLSSVLEKIDEGEGTAGKLINNDSLYVNLNNVAADLDALIIDLNENPKKYVNFSLFGGKNKD